MPVRFHKKKTIFRYSEHEYEPIAAPSPLLQRQSHLHLQTTMATAPVVRITDTDVVPVADSDDSIDDRTRLPPELTKEGDVVLPLDGKIEDSAMEGCELVETGDTSEELESPQEFQDRLEERFLNAATPGAESRTDAEVNTSQVDSLALEELPLRRGARGIPQRIKTQAGKLRSRLRSIQRPTFTFAEKQKSEKTRSTSSGKSDRSRTEKRPSRMDRIRSSFSERPRFSLPNRPKFNLPDKSKFHLPERPKFNLPGRGKFHFPERPKFNIKKPNIRLPSALTRIGSSTPHHEQDQRSTESTVGSRRNIFDFATYPRIFDKKSKTRSDYTTSTPKDSRAQSAESATFPRRGKAMNANDKWAEQYDDNAFMGEHPSGVTVAERSHPWRHPSLEEPRLSIRMEAEALAAIRAIPWEDKRNQKGEDQEEEEEEEEMQYMDYEQESPEVSERQAPPRFKEILKTEESYEPEEGELDPGLYNPRDDQGRAMIMNEDDFRPIPRSRSLDEQVTHLHDDESYEESFPRAARRRYRRHKIPSEEDEYEEDIEADEEQEPSSVHSDREQQQSSGSSCDRRRRGVIEDIDSDEFFLRESGLSQDDMNLGKYLSHHIRDALRAETNNALADDSMMPPVPPQRPKRTRSLSKRKEDSMESFDVAPPEKPKRERRRGQSIESGDENSRERRSESRHRIVYQAEGTPGDATSLEPLDDIVVVKPMRRKSKSSQRSQSQLPTDTSSIPESKTPIRPPTPTESPYPPAVPLRRKRSRQEVMPEQRNGNIPGICNGHTNWGKSDSMHENLEPVPLTSDEFLHDEEELAMDNIMAASREDIHRRSMQRRSEKYGEPVPIPPKRRSRSRGTSVAQDEDRTSHGAESLPDLEYTEDDILRDDMDSTRDLAGYAVIGKREKPPRPPPPRRKRGKFATLPKSATPKRPERAYSTLRSATSRDENILSETISTHLEPTGSTAYIEIDGDDIERKALRSDETLHKMQGRPLPAPPRPPRARKDRSIERDIHASHEFTMESSTATQTDPLPDDMIIEEEITQAKLVVAPSTAGSQIFVSMERIPSPTSISMPAVPPLPSSQRLRRDAPTEPGFDTVSLKSPSPVREREDVDERPHLSAPQLEQSMQIEDLQARILRSALLSDEPLRIANLEVGDLRVDRLSVSQIEASKIVASEVDALVITASELKGMSSHTHEESVPPSIIQELIAIKQHLETVAASQAQQASMRTAKVTEETEKMDIPSSHRQSTERQASSDEVKPTTTEEESRSARSDDATTKTSEDEKVVKKEVTQDKDQNLPVTHTLALIQVEAENRETPPTQTLSVSQIENKDKEMYTRLFPTVQDTQDKSLQILDSDIVPMTLRTTEELDAKKSFTTQPSPAVQTPAECVLSEATKQSPNETSDLATESKKASSQSSPESQKSLQQGVNLKFKTDEAGKESYSSESLEEESSIPAETEKRSRKSRSRSSSPIKGSVVRQTASPVRSLPPAISVTPDTPDTNACHSISNDLQPQRAVISYSSDIECESDSLRDSSSPIPSFPFGGTHFIAFPASQVPSQLLSIAGQANQRIDSDPGVIDTTYQLVRVIRVAGVRAMRHFASYLSSVTGGEESAEKIREVEITLCALLLLIAGLLIYFFNSPRTVTHYHHWDYFNPPQ